jgi:hypothetical protein
MGAMSGGLDSRLGTIIKNRNTRILYNGKRLVLHKANEVKKPIDENRGDQANYSEHYPETQVGSIGLTVPDHTLITGYVGSVSKAASKMASGVVANFFDDVNNPQ